jgi:hypothetical protein
VRLHRHGRPRGQASPFLADAFEACADAVAEWRREASFGPVDAASRDRPRPSPLRRLRRFVAAVLWSEERRFVVFRQLSIAILVGVSAFAVEFVLMGRL